MYFKPSLISILIAQIDLMEQKHDTYRHHIPCIYPCVLNVTLCISILYTRFYTTCALLTGSLYTCTQIYFYIRFMRRQIKQ